MCRKCFYAYEIVLKAKAIIELSAVKALDAIVPGSTSRTDGLQASAKCTSSSASTIAAPPPKRRPLPTFAPDPEHTPGKTQSPGVAVSIVAV